MNEQCCSQKTWVIKCYEMNILALATRFWSEYPEYPGVPEYNRLVPLLLVAPCN